MDYLGAHMSIAGGLAKAIDRGTAAGCGVIQIFTQNSNQWRGKAVSDSDASLFREKREETGLNDIVSHDIYLINLASAPGEVRDKSLAGFLEEMERCARLGIDKIVMHPGSHLGEGEETGIKRIVEAFDTLLEKGCDFTGKISWKIRPGRVRTSASGSSTSGKSVTVPHSRTGSVSASTPAMPSLPAMTLPPTKAIERFSMNSTGSSAWRIFWHFTSMTRRRGWAAGSTAMSTSAGEPSAFPGSVFS